MSVEVDENSRTLYIIAPEETFTALQPILDEIDRPRRQVYIEALIADITTELAAEFGLQFQSLRGLAGNRGPGVTSVGGTNLGPSGGAIGDGTGAMGQGLSVGVVSGYLTLPDGSSVANMLALARALESTADANILSTPTLLALDNEEAKIVVGQNVPFITGSFTPQSGATSGSTANPFQTIERKDIGLTFQITPRVLNENDIELNIFQEVSSLVPATVNTGASDIVTNKRSLQSSVLARDKEIIVIGGLIQNRMSVSQSKVPLLGDIPVLGALFRYEQRKQVKTNLMVFLRPHLLPTGPNGAAEITDSRFEYILDMQGQIRPEKFLMLPDPTPVKKLPGSLDEKFSGDQLKKKQKKESKSGDDS